MEDDQKTDEVRYNRSGETKEENLIQIIEGLSEIDFLKESEIDYMPGKGLEEYNFYPDNPPGFTPPSKFLWEKLIDDNIIISAPGMYDIGRAKEHYQDTVEKLIKSVDMRLGNSKLNLIDDLVNMEFNRREDIEPKYEFILETKSENFSQPMKIRHFDKYKFFELMTEFFESHDLEIKFKCLRIPNGYRSTSYIFPYTREQSEFLDDLADSAQDDGTAISYTAPKESTD